MKKTTYRASRHVRLGVPDEHAYNLFLSFEEICCRLGLWAESVGWKKIQNAHFRLTKDMRNGNAKRKHEAQKFVQDRTPYASTNGN